MIFNHNSTNLHLKTIEAVYVFVVRLFHGRVKNIE